LNVSKPLPEYDKPPVLEVVFGIQFSALKGIQTRHFGEFWTKIRDEFPITRDMPPLPEISETPSVELLLMPPLRRVFLLSSDQRYVVQLQESRFNLNWRKVEAGDKYPRFGVVFSKFQQAWGDFSAFGELAGLGNLIPNRYELTYVNHLEIKGDVFSSELEAKAKMFRWQGLDAQFLPAPASASASWQFQMPESKGIFSANLSHAKRQDATDLLVLNMACAGPASSKFTLREWFETAHEWIVRGFTDLTTSEAHKEWGRTS
jgi:uncharacterized protein (TIGR04255 family)